MKVVLLSPYPERVGTIFKDDTVIFHSHKGPIPQCDFIVSYGYRYLVQKDILDQYKDRIINVHGSYLPWNRGADPNFWSFYDDSIKGVTIHHMDEGFDTGDIVAQLKLRWTKPEVETLETTYWKLQDQAVFLLGHVWQQVRAGKILPRIKQPKGGSIHKNAEFLALQSKLPAGWKTPIEYVEAMGRAAREAV